MAFFFFRCGTRVGVALLLQKAPKRDGSQGTLLVLAALGAKEAINDYKTDSINLCVGFGRHCWRHGYIVRRASAAAGLLLTLLTHRIRHLTQIKDADCDPGVGLWAVPLW